jgi:hypothetical protein
MDQRSLKKRPTPNESGRTELTPYLESGGAALARPHEDTDMMQFPIDESALHVADGAHALLLLDRAGWRIASNLEWPKNITPILPPPKSPELNPDENGWR